MQSGARFDTEPQGLLWLQDAMHNMACPSQEEELIDMVNKEMPMFVPMADAGGLEINTWMSRFDLGTASSDCSISGALVI